MQDITKVKNMIDGALKNDYEFFETEFSDLVDKKLMDVLSKQFERIKQQIFNYDDLKKFAQDYEINNPNKDKFVPELDPKDRNKDF